jgi:hypothetical protein
MDRFQLPSELLNRQSSCQGNQYNTEKAGSTARPSSPKITPAGSICSTQPGGPLCWASHVAFGKEGGGGRQAVRGKEGGVGGRQSALN